MLYVDLWGCFVVKLSRKREKVAAYDFAAYDFLRFPGTKPHKIEIKKLNMIFQFLFDKNT
jgi:hypothetical protein